MVMVIDAVDKHYEGCQAEGYTHGTLLKGVFQIHVSCLLTHVLDKSSNGLDTSAAKWIILNGGQIDLQPYVDVNNGEVFFQWLQGEGIKGCFTYRLMRLKSFRIDQSVNLHHPGFPC
jgi:hypothetical protein